MFIVTEYAALMCCLNIGLNLQILKTKPLIHLGKFEAIKRHLIVAFVCENVARSNDARSFESLHAGAIW